MKFPMTIQEAKLLFADSGEDLQDFYEEKLFEFKQFFLTKPPVEKVYSGKLDKLNKFQEAYELLTEPVAHSIISETVDVSFSKDVRGCVGSFEAEKSKFKMNVLQAENAIQVNLAVQQYLKVSNYYMSLWPEQKNDQEVKISVEPDPMLIRSAISDFESHGYNTFSEIEKLEDDHALKVESKRLNLLFIKNQE